MYITTPGTSIRCSFFFAVALIGLLVLAWLVYQPGLSGAFLFDDFVNLNALGATGRIHDWPSFLRYITSGSADPTGRPLSLLTFLLDAQNWPADAYSFKRTNVLLHLINGALLCWTTLELGARSGLSKSQNQLAALTSVAIWLLHPLFVSTTLYIVQREAMLPATFTLCGLLCWCRGRTQLDQGHIWRSWIWAATGSFFCTLMATLSKANGVLLPLLIATAEYCISRLNSRFPDEERNAVLRAERIGLLLLPILALITYLLLQIPSDIRNAAEHRPWTITQRLLSEPRVLMNYLYLLWIPRSISQGVFNDQTIASTGWLTPWTTLPSIAGTISLCFIGWRLRKKYPIAAFAILFYFAGQVMESTFVPLELFFEHRNYLPAMFMFWPFAVWLTDNRGRWPRLALGMLIIAIVAGSTWSSAKVWGNLRQQALIWGKTNPDSARAQAFAASVEMAYQHYPQAIERLQTASAKQPDEVQLTLNLVDAECAIGGVSPTTWKRALYSLQHTTNGSHAVFDWYTDAIRRTQSNTCPSLSLQNIEDALQASRSNPIYGKQYGRRQDYAHIAGLIDLAKGQPQEALNSFNTALLTATDRGVALEQAAILGSDGYPALGLRHLAFAQVHATDVKPGFGMPLLHDWILTQQGYWQHETQVLHDTLAEDAAERQKKPNPSSD